MLRFRESFRFLVRKYAPQLGLILGESEKRLARQIETKIRNRNGGSPGWKTIERQLDTKNPVQNPQDSIRSALIEFVVTGLQGKVKGVSAEWFNQSSLEELEQEISRCELQVDPGGQQETLFNYPAIHRDIIERLKQNLCRVFVSYRYALENVVDGFPAAVIAREVCNFEPDGNEIRFAMSFRPGGSHTEGRQRIFEGQVMPLGLSLMCVGIHAGSTAPDFIRGRALFMGRDQQVARCWFGLMTTTMATIPYAPCSSCVLLLQAEINNEEVDEFRRRVTVIRPLEEILASDFSMLKPAQKKQLKIFLSNSPREHKGGRQDKVLRLWPDRFGSEMPQIAETLFKPGSKTPFSVNWKQTRVLDD